MTPSERFQRLIARIDELNRQDPNRDLAGGTPQPREWLYAQQLTAWVLRLNPKASEALQIAARGQHIQRWSIPRDRYERNRKGYLRWRETLKTFHADTVAGLMKDEGYSEETVGRVRRLILKKELGTDPETQTLEDALCLLFLETQFHDLRAKTPAEKMIEVLQKTWKKMSPQAREEALRLPLASEDLALLTRALGSAGSR